MSIHWKELDKPAKIKAIKTVWENGMSASEIACFFEGASRNAVIGIYGRYPSELATHPLRGKSKAKAKKPKQARTDAKGASLPIKRASIPMPVSPFSPNDRLITAGRPLDMLKANECRFSVNDAAKGELHLFCGMPGKGAWCENHLRLTYRDREVR